MPTVRVEPLGVVFEARPGERLMDLARRHGYWWPTICQGSGICTQCAVVLDDETARRALAAPGAWETDTIERNFEPSDPAAGVIRLACQAKVVDDLVVHKPGVRLA